MMRKAVQNPALRALVVNKLGAVKQFRALSISCSVVQFKPVVPSSSECSYQTVSSSSFIGSVGSFSVRGMSSSNVDESSSELSIKSGVKVPLYEYLAENPPSDTMSKQKCRFNDCLTEGKIELRFLIPRTTIDALTAAGDTFLNSLKDKYGASLELADWKKPEGVLTLICRQEDAIECFKQILPSLNDYVSLLVHTRHSQFVNGDMGKHRKEVLKANKLHNDQFRSIRNAVPFSTDRVFVLKGDDDALALLMQFIVDKIKEIPLETLDIPYNSQSYQGALIYGGYGLDHDGGREDGISHIRLSIPRDLFAPIKDGTDELSFRSIRRKSGVEVRSKNPNQLRELTGLRFDGLQPQVEMCLFLFKKALESTEEGKAYLRGEWKPSEE